LQISKKRAHVAQSELPHTKLLPREAEYHGFITSPDIRAAHAAQSYVRKEREETGAHV